MSNDLGKIQSALDFIPPDVDRDTWIKVGMALQDELDSSGFDVFDGWSAGGKGYNAKHTLAVWKSMKSGGVTIASLFGIAKDYGWVPTPGAKPSQEELAKQRAEAEKRAAARAAEAAKLAEAAVERANALWDAAAPATDDHPYLKRKGVKAHGLRVGRWEVVNPETGEIRLISKNALLVPICDRTKAIRSLQAVFASKAMGGRDKDYLRDGAKSGNFHAIGRPLKHGGKLVFVLAEGYATGASVHEASAHCVLICFDTSNLVTVAKAIRERQPDAVILIAGDNDRWNRRPDGTPYNPGRTAAEKAAKEAGALVALPPFTAADQTGTDDRGDPEGPSDWNDWDQKYGRESIAELIAAALDGKPVMPSEPDDKPELAAEPSAGDTAPWDDSDIPGFEDEPASGEQPLSDYQPPADDGEEELEELQNNKHFTVLGYDGGTYYMFVHAKKQVMSLTKGDISDIGLLEFAPANWWEMYFPGNKGGVDRRAVAGWLFAVAHARGIYDPDRIRGRGAWTDSGRAVFHHGGYLTIDGQEAPLTSIKSAYVYPMARQLAEPATKVLSADEGKWLLSVAERVRWSTEGSAALMAGWTMLSPICGALKWRPHIWITGGAGTGKTTVQRDFCAALLRGVSVYAQGDSSEAGIRQELKADSLPVLIDEIESNDDGDKRRVAAVVGMIRKSSSESQARTFKGTVTGDGQHFHIRSMFCLASINVNLPGKADIDRLTKLVIRQPSVGGEAHWAALADEFHKITSDETISSRLLARALSMMNTVKECIAVFTTAAAKRFGTQRHGDQYGTLLAGCWCLTHDSVATPGEADALIARYNWDEHTEDHDLDDALEALKAITNAKIKMGGAIGERTIYELVREASTLHRIGDIEQAIAEATLKRHGIRLDKSMLLFGTSVPNLKELLHTASYVTDVRGQLLRLEGATRLEKAVKFNGVASKCVAVPLNLVLDDDAVPKPDDHDDYPL